MTVEGDRPGIWLGIMLCCGLRINKIQTTWVTPNGNIKVLEKGNMEKFVPAPERLRTAINQKKKGGKQWAKNRKLIWMGLKKMNIRKPHSPLNTYARKQLPENLIQKLRIDS